MATPISMPLMGITMEEGIITRWLVDDGASVAKGDVVLEFETDKINAEVEAPVDGIVRGITALAGEAVKVQGVCAWVLADGEQLILAVTENGFGKFTSAYAYRTTGRGGHGIINIATSARNGAVVATFPTGEADEVVLITDGGQIIRFPAVDIRIAGRNTQGVTLFRTAEDERVVSVARLAEAGEDRDAASE